jgi:hypothetical protein
LGTFRISLPTETNYLIGLFYTWKAIPNWLKFLFALKMD